MNDTERWIQGILKVQTKILDQNVALLKSQTGIMEDLKALSQRLGNVERALSIKNDTTLDSPNCPITMNMEQLKKRILELEIEKPFLASQGGPSSISFEKSNRSLSIRSVCRMLKRGESVLLYNRIPSVSFGVLPDRISNSTNRI